MLTCSEEHNNLSEKTEDAQGNPTIKLNKTEAYKNMIVVFCE